MSRITVYSTGTCPYCVKAKALLDALEIPYREIRLDIDKSAMREFLQVTNNARTVPQILIDGRCIGGYTDLAALHAQGGLDSLLPGK